MTPHQITPAVLDQNARTNRWIRCLAAFVAVLLLALAVAGLTSTLASLHAGSRQRALLVDCVTPGPAEGPVTGHPCWDRLHDPSATGDAVALIVDNIYCDHRRAQAMLPAVSDPRTPCRFQTDPSIYPGDAGPPG